MTRLPLATLSLTIPMPFPGLPSLKDLAAGQGTTLALVPEAQIVEVGRPGGVTVWLPVHLVLRMFPMPEKAAEPAPAPEVARGSDPGRAPASPAGRARPTKG